MSGAVFHNIAEGVMSRSLVLSVEDARDSLSVFTPEVKQGDRASVDYVLGSLGIDSKGVEVSKPEFATNTMPSTIGMGASDAVYLIEQQGIHVRLHGTGEVCRQSIAPGTPLEPGMTCFLELQ